MKYPRIHQKIYNEPWAITETGYDSIRRTFLDHVSGRRDSIAPDAFFDREGSSKPKSLHTLLTSQVATLNISGIIGKRLSSLETKCGGCDLDAVRESFDTLLTTSSVQTIILHGDTPGGTVTGVAELGRAIFEASQSSGKQILGYTDTQCCSAGYWLLSQAQALYAAPSAHVGSIGVIITLANVEKYDEKIGVKYETIKSGHYKDLGNPHRAMTDDERSLLQAQVDRLAQQFYSVVETSRPEVSAQSLGAKVLTGDQAQAAGLIDGQYDTLDHLLAQLV